MKMNAWEKKIGWGLFVGVLASSLSVQADQSHGFFGIEIPDTTQEKAPKKQTSSPPTHRVKKETSSSTQEELASRFQIGGSYAHLDLDPHGGAQFAGNLGGILAQYAYRPKNDFFGAARVSWLEGNTDGSAGRRGIFYLDTQERFGYTFGTKAGGFLFTLFSGLGYRHVEHKLHPKVGSSIKFKYNEFYVPVGFLTDVAVNSWFTWCVNFTWMPQVFPTVSIVPLKGANWTLTDQLENFYAEMPLDFSLTKSKRFHLIINPFYEHWKDGHSTARTSTGLPLGLPGNTYDFWGINLNFAYAF